MKTYKYLTKEQKSMIRELSKTHYPKEIAKMFDCTPECITHQQHKMGIVNPKRKYVKTNRERLATAEGYFDIKQWSKIMAF